MHFFMCPVSVVFNSWEPGNSLAKTDSIHGVRSGELSGFFMIATFTGPFQRLGFPEIDLRVLTHVIVKIQKKLIAM